MSTPTNHRADERELRRLVSDWRRGRATKTIWEAIQDAYVAVLAVAVFGAMLVTLIFRVQVTNQACESASCHASRTLLPFAALAGAAALAMLASRLFGPVLASAAEGFWMLDAPLNRARLLRGRLVAALALAGAVGAAVGALVAALTGSPATLIVAWAVSTGLVAAAVVAFAAAEQGVERTWVTRVLVTVLTLLTLGVLVLVVAIAAGWVSLVVTAQRELVITALVGGLGLLVLVVAGALGLARLNRIRRTRLVSGGALVSGMAGAMYALDLGLAHDIVVERKAVERGQVRPAAGSGLGLTALVRRDFRRLVRTPTVFGPAIASIVVPYASVALGLGHFTALISAMVLFWSLVPLMGTLRVLTRSLGLARCMPFTGPELRQAALVVPGIAGLIWSLACLPAMVQLYPASIADAAIITLLTGVAGVLGATRWTAAKPIDYGAPMLATQMGAMPSGMMVNAVRGFEVTALITAPIVFGGHWLIAGVIAAIVFWFVMGNFDMQALQEQQEQQKKELEKARAARKR